MVAKYFMSLNLELMEIALGLRGSQDSSTLRHICAVHFWGVG